MAEQIQGSVSYEKVRTKEETWKPPETGIDVVLEPSPGAEPYFPPSAPKPFDALTPMQKPTLVLNIETTGLMPFDSRLISIACIDVRYPDSPMDFTGQNEEKILREFLDWFNLNGFTTIVGYNVAFDYRFIFTKAMKYKMQAPQFYKATIYDVMSKMKQIKEEFVYGFNTPGKLDEWTNYYFGIKGPLTFEELLEAWEDKDMDKIRDHNRKKVNQCLLLYGLLLYTQGDLTD